MKVTPEFLSVRVTPKASRSRIELDSGGRVKVYVTAPPEDGKANTAVCELVAKLLGVPRTSVEVASGHTSRDKNLRLSTISISDAMQIVEQKLSQPKLIDP